MDIRKRLRDVRDSNRRLESALGTGALAKKAVVAQAFSDQLWTDPMSGKTYTRYPVTLTQWESSTYLTLRDGSAGSTVNIWEYEVPTGSEYQFIMNFAEHYVTGNLASSSGSASVVDLYACTFQCWDRNERDLRGIIWTGTSTLINDSAVMRQQGHPLTYNGDKEVRAIGGDKLIFKLTTPTGGTAVEMTPASCGISSLAFACYELVEKRSG
jgi:hypothetical protein